MVAGSGTVRALTLVCAYIPPRGSTAVDLQRPDVWGVLREVVSGAMLSSDVMILGDLNARTGTLPDFVSGCPTSFHGPPPVGTPRRSKDVVSSGCVNAHGRALLALCRGTGMRIVNGRTSGDQHGEFTFRSMQGPSVIDYVVACPSLMGAIASLRVVHAGVSDHDALVVCLPRRPRDCATCAPRVHRKPLMVGPDKLKNWAENILPEFVDRFRAIARLADAIATDDVSACGVACESFDRLIEGTYNRVWVRQTADPGARVRLPQSRYTLPYAHSLSLQRRSLHAAARRFPGSPLVADLRAQYRRCLQRYRRRERGVETRRLTKLLASDPGRFWRRYRSRSQLPSAISHVSWLSHFSSLLGSQPGGNATIARDACAVLPVSPSRGRSTDRLSPGSVTMDNSPFSTSEVMAALYRLRSGSSTLGTLSAAALKVAGGDVLSSATALLNACARVGVIPPCWAVCAVTPIYKSGDRANPENYRGIAVGTLMSRLYASMLEQRLSRYLDGCNLRARGQAGFRRDHRCADHIFTLNSLINRYRTARAPLYCCFVDFRKAYDSVPRALLWQKLTAVGVTDWMLKAIKALYASVPMCVSTNEGLTDTFQCATGVKQGCPLSPTLFGVYLDDLESHLLSSPLLYQSHLPVIAHQVVPPLMYADDVALLATSAQGLQTQLSSVHAYATMWGLSINIDKTKVMVFTGVCGPAAVCSLQIENKVVEQVVTFRYLGVEFHCKKGVLNAGVSRAETGAQQALAVRARLRELNLRDPALQVRFFDTLVAGGLLYGAEIWGAGRLSIDKLTGEGVHRGYLRGMLGVRCASTPAPSLLAELGRFPLYVTAARMICKFWDRLVSMDADRLLKEMFIQDLDQARSGVKVCWSYRVSSFLNSIGLRTDLLVPALIDVDHVVTNLKAAYVADVNSATGTKWRGI